MKYDNFPAFQKIESTTTDFSATRYETWSNGKMVDGSKCQVHIKISPKSKLIGRDTNAVTLNWSKGRAGIISKFTLDVGFSQNDRLTYATLPKESSGDAVGIVAMRSVIGINDSTAKISDDTPYCGNLFLKFGVLVKVTFAFSNPEKLIEFYSEEAEDQVISAATIKCVLELLIEDYDSDGAYVGFNSIKDKVKEEYDFNVEEKHFKQAETMLNSGVGGYKEMVSTGYTGMFMGEKFFKSNYGRGPMRTVLNMLSSELK